MPDGDLPRDPVRHPRSRRQSVLRQVSGKPRSLQPARYAKV